MRSENSGSVAATNWLAWSTTWPHLITLSHEEIGLSLEIEEESWKSWKSWRMRLGKAKNHFLFGCLIVLFTMFFYIIILVLPFIIACHACGSISHFFLVFSKNLGARMWFLLYPGISSVMLSFLMQRHQSRDEALPPGSRFPVSKTVGDRPKLRKRFAQARPATPPPDGIMIQPWGLIRLIRLILRKNQPSLQFQH